MLETYLANPSPYIVLDLGAYWGSRVQERWHYTGTGGRVFQGYHETPTPLSRYLCIGTGARYRFSAMWSIHSDVRFMTHLRVISVNAGFTVAFIKEKRK
jgi:hypothetical protein